MKRKLPGVTALLLALSYSVAVTAQSSKALHAPEQDVKNETSRVTAVQKSTVAHTSPEVRDEQKALQKRQQQGRPATAKRGAIMPEAGQKKVNQ